MNSSINRSALALVAGTEASREPELTQEQLFLLQSGNRPQALNEFLQSLLSQEQVIVKESDYIVPKGKRVYKQISFGQPLTLEDMTPSFVDGQVERSVTGDVVLAKAKDAYSKKLMGAEHLSVIIDNYWRYPNVFNRYGVAFFGTIFAPADKFSDKLSGVDLTCLVLEYNDAGRLTYREKDLSQNFDRFYPIAMLP